MGNLDAGRALMIAIALVGLAAYFLPACVAEIRKKRNKTAILVLNLFLGWTLIGWVVALVWASTVDDPTKEVSS